MQLNKMLSRQVSGLSGGDTERSRRRVDMVVRRLDFDLGLHRSGGGADCGGSGSFRDHVSVNLHLRDGRTDRRTDKNARQQSPPRSSPSRRVVVAATRRPCQKQTDGRTNERTDGRMDGQTDAGTRIWCISDIWWQ